MKKKLIIILLLFISLINIYNISFAESNLSLNTTDNSNNNSIQVNNTISDSSNVGNPNDLFGQYKSYHNYANYEEAIVCLKKAVEFNRLHKYNDAVKELEFLIPTHSDSFNLWYQLGLAYSGLNNYKKTIESLKKAVEINSKDYESWRLLAWAYSESGQFKESLFAFNRASNLSI